jgi:hypothetical protein
MSIVEKTIHRLPAQSACVILTLTAYSAKTPDVAPIEIGIVKPTFTMPIVEVPFGTSPANFAILRETVDALKEESFIGLCRPPPPGLKLMSVAAGGVRIIPPAEENMAKLKEFASTHFPHCFEVNTIINGIPRCVTVFGQYNSAEIDLSEYVPSVVMEGSMQTTLYTPK